MPETTDSAVHHPFAELIGLEITTGSEGTSTARIDAEDKHLNPHGVVHGAVIYALADTGMGAALTQTLDSGQICSTIEIKINYFRPTFPGPLRCETRVVHRGKRTAALESEVFDDASKLLARATGTFMILAAEI